MLHIMQSNHEYRYMQVTITEITKFHSYIYARMNINHIGQGQALTRIYGL